MVAMFPQPFYRMATRGPADEHCSEIGRGDGRWIARAKVGGRWCESLAGFLHGAAQDVVDQRGIFGVSITDEEPDPCGVSDVLEIHEQVADGLTDPYVGGVCGGAEYPNTSAGVVDGGETYWRCPASGLHSASRGRPRRLNRYDVSWMVPAAIVLCAAAVPATVMLFGISRR
ncbi:hypothetical protein [Lentzea aerocolonigenes]|uniref:hypothetical protein n=1 Tax=Lentzea aerocolonigenes TaxID=68170 RepID=UPI0012E2E921|nr:hypothetical protein [Lentzea aerocolonigenes]